jgi:nucleotide-binding universal stress UspA family protein
MIRLNTNIQLDNGAVAKHYVLGIVTVSTQKIDLTLDGFVSTKLEDVAMNKLKLERQQKELINQFRALAEKEEQTNEEIETMNNLQDEINEIANQINSSKEYSNYVVDCEFITIPYIENITEEYILEEILKTDKFKDATQYSE